MQIDLLIDDVVIIEIDELDEVVEAVTILDLTPLLDEVVMQVIDEMVERDDVIALIIIDMDEVVYDEHIDYISEHLKYIIIVYMLNDEIDEVVVTQIDVDVEPLDDKY